MSLSVVDREEYTTSMDEFFNRGSRYGERYFVRIIRLVNNEFRG